MKRGPGRPRKWKYCFNCHHDENVHEDLETNEAERCKSYGCRCDKYVENCMSYIDNLRPITIKLPNYPALFGGAIAMLLGVAIMWFTLLMVPDKVSNFFEGVGAMAVFITGFALFGLGFVIIFKYPTIKYRGLFEKEDDE